MQNQLPNTEILPDSYKILQQSIYSNVGIVLEEDKHYLLEGRLAPIVKQLGLSSIDELCALLGSQRNSEVERVVAEAMTTNETYFFREPMQYEAIRTVLLPKLKEECRQARKMSFWSAAASSGQEAYSLAMLLLQEDMQEWNATILGTDFNSKIVERARAGLYQQIEVSRGLPAKLLVKHFQRSGLHWQLEDKVRRMARFDTIDLRKSMRTLGPFDLVFCRNVMIYFDAETKRNIMKQIHGTMFRGGWLLLGGAETPSDLAGLFEKIRIGNVTVHVAR